ncbi:MAG TPA: S8 family serine peptidase [Egicoccus sp.]|nr:S8 family serine peptidase [Egicoccus sp.]HSK22728.1 S8 family serine peptidase [Egicoccus sp.]
MTDRSRSGTGRWHGRLLALLMAAALAVPATGVAVAQSTPPPVNDPLYAQQHHLQIIRAPQAWQITRGSAGIDIAVIDTGVSPDHPDLAGAFWTDGDGYSGYDYLRGTRDTYLDGGRDWHGTAIAGIAAARADDGIGTAGVAPGVSISVRRILESRDAMSTPYIESGVGRPAQAIRDAAAAGADVILLTWGHSSLTVEHQALLRDAIADAKVPVVAAAGNGFVDLSSRDSAEAGPWPARFNDLANLVTVAASDRSGYLFYDEARDEGSNYGHDTVDLAAPGDYIIAPDVGFEADGYHTFYGTSFAAPQVAAALALGRSVAPTMSANELVGEVIRSARPSSNLRGRIVSGGVLDVAEFLRNVRRRACTDEFVDGTSPFSDVSIQGTHGYNIACIAYWGVAEGVGGGRFAPGRDVTRGQMASFLARILAIADDPAADAEAPDAFGDDDGSTHEAAINRLAAAGIAAGGSDGRFRPGDPVTRAQMASFLVRTIEHLTDLDPKAAPRDWFDDVDGVHAQAILAARELGLTLGTTEPRLFEPTLRTRRDHMASFVSRTLEVLRREGIELTPMAEIESAADGGDPDSDAAADDTSDPNTSDPNT